MTITRNPTRTRAIERAWLSEVNRRWALFRRIVVARLRSDNETGGLAANAEDVFRMSSAQQRAYMAYLDVQIDAVLLGARETPDGTVNWQARYQAEAYMRGLETTRAALLAQGASIVPTETERLAAQGFQAFTATPALSVGVAAGPIHQDALAFISNRSYIDLKGWTDAMSKQTRAILFDAVAQGKGIDKVVREMTERIDVSRSRARLIARTETNQAYGRSVIAETSRAAAELNEPVGLRWLTARDTRVRHLHAEWHGVVMTPEQAARNKNVSPWGCRCGFAPVIAEADTPAKTARFKAEREQLLAEEQPD